jgi:hypothetical protein
MISILATSFKLACTIVFTTIFTIVVGVVVFGCLAVFLEWLGLLD